MADKAVSPSLATITKGQCGKFMDVGVDALIKSGLPSEAAQYVLENEAAEIAANLVTDIRRRVETRQRAVEPHLLERRLFNPESFLGNGWKVDEQVGTRSGGNLNAGQIVCKDYLKQRESYINGKERLKRIKQTPEDTQLDAEDFLALWQEEGHATLKWLYDTKGITFLSFWGTILRGPGGDLHVLYLCRSDDGSWSWDCDWVDDAGWNAGNPAAVLATHFILPKVF